ncbi:FlgD immunoglobulin-like domain containing protein, partial [Candidatus Latescibacterota bacterium]
LVVAAPVLAFEPSWGNVINVYVGDDLWGDFGESAWSPDGSTLALGLPPHGIVTVSVDGGNATELYTGEEGKHIVFFGLDYSPDGGKIVFAYTDDSEIWENNLSPPTRIAIVDVETGALEQVTTGSSPRWSPSGQILCYSRTVYSRTGSKLILSETSILIYDMSTQTERVLITKPGTEGTVGIPQFFSDESAILYRWNDEDRNGSLFTIPVNGGDPQKIEVNDESGNPLDIGWISLHPDGIHFVMGAWKGIDWVNMQTGVVTRITPTTPQYGVMAPRLSLDGKRVSFTSTQLRAPWWETCILDLDNSLLNDEILTLSEADYPIPFTILTNHPNPFNPSTTISFTLPDGGYTELAVYNMAGQRIRTLVAGELTAGVCEVVWDGRDDSGNPVSSGIFVSRLDTGDTVVTNRMTLVK